MLQSLKLFLLSFTIKKKKAMETLASETPLSIGDVPFASLVLFC